MSKNNCDRKKLCLKVLKKYSFTFQGETFQFGDTFGTDDPCEASAWLEAAESAYKALTNDTEASVSAGGLRGGNGLAGVYRACEAAKRRRAEAVESATEFYKRVLAQNLGEPSPEPGLGDSPPGGEETPKTMDAPSTEPIAEVGIENPEDLPDYAKSIEGVANGEEMLERIKKMRETMSEEEIEEWFRKNRGPVDEPHPEHSEPLNADGVCAGDPVLLASGQFDLRVVDVELPSVGLPLRFERVYRSGPRYFGPFGFNWDHTYNQSLRLLARDRVAHWTGQLQEHVYEPASNGTYEPPLGVHRRLRRVSGPGDPERWELEEALGNKLTFAPAPNAPPSGQLPLVRFEDRHGNVQLLDYDDEGRLARVHDGFGRALTLHYGRCDILEAVEDHTGRRWSYLHDEQAEHLVAVRTPAVEGGHHQVEYHYDEGYPDPNYRHNLTRVSDGKHVVVENEYSRDLGPNYARVIYQRLGGVAISYAYEQLQSVPPIPENVDAPATRTVVRREGEGLRVYTFNFRGELLDERLRLVADGTMRVLVHAYRYDPAGNLKLKMEPDGLTVLFDYDHEAEDPRARGNLLRTSLRPSPLTPGPTRTISQARYEPRYQLRTETRDEAGAVTKFVYDFDQGPGGTGKLVQLKHPSATLTNGELQHAIERFTCNASGRWTEHITAAGHRHVRRYHPNGVPGAGLLAEELFDADGTPVRSRYEYDAAGRLVREEDGLGNVTTYVNDALDRTTRIVPPLVDGVSAELRFVFDPSGLLVREEGPRGSYEDSALVGDTIVTVHRYDAHGRRVETVIGHGSSSERRMRVSYNADGQLSAFEDSLGRIRKLKYDERGLVIEEIAAADTPEARRVRHRYDRAGRRVATVTADREHRYEYDRYGRLTAHVRPDGTREERERGVNDWLLKLRVVGRPAPGEPPRMLSEKGYEYDERGRIRRTFAAVFTDDPSTAVQNTTQVFPDPDGRTVRVVDHSGAVSLSSYSGIGLPLSAEDAAGNRRTFAYDAVGNCLSVTHEERRAAGPADTFTISYTYDARRLRRTETDALGNRMSWSYDACGLLTSELDPLGVEMRYARDIEGQIVTQERHVGGAIVRHVIERDLGGRVTALTDPAGQRSQLERSAFDEVTRILLPDGIRIERMYRPTGELLHERHADGRELRLNLAEHGRRITLEATPGPGDLAVPPQELEKDGLGRLVSARSGGNVISRRYDSLGRVVAERRGNDETSYTYDDGARTVLRTRSSGRTERMHYDALGRLTRVVLVTPSSGDTALPAGTELCRYSYDGPGRVASRHDGNGVIDERDYDHGMRLASQTVRRSGGGAIAQLKFLHDAIGRTVALARGPAPLRSALARYDLRSRLVGLRTGVTLPPLPTVSTQAEADAVLSTLSAPPGAASEEFTVSNADETLERRELAGGGSSTTHVFVPGPFCRIAQMDGVPVAYDARGNLLDDGERTFTYDAFGRLVRAVRKSDNALLLALEHDALGRITTRTVAGESATLLYEGNTLLSELRPNGERTDYVPGLAPGETVCVSRDGQAYWMHQDENRNLFATTDAAGAVVDRYAYSAFGIPGVFTANGAPRAAPASAVGPVFGGHPYLEAPGLFLMGPRLYDPNLGRFLQPDPAWPRDGASPYSYAGHDPINLTDPTGLCLPQPGSSGSGAATGSGSGSGSGGGTGSSSGGKGGGSSWGMNFGRGMMNLSWGVLLFALGALILMGPFGWFGGLVAAMSMSAGFASFGVGLARMVIAHTHTEEKDRELGRAVSTATSIASGPGSLIGATIASGTGHDPEKGALIGGLTEGGLSLAKGLASVIRMEYTFWRLPKLSWLYKKDLELQAAIRASIGPAAASKVRPSLLFYPQKQIEYWELSHFISEKTIKGWERVFNRPWNFRPMWGSEHAWLDPDRFRFIQRALKPLVESKQMSGLAKWQHRTPDWLLDVERGTGQVLFHGFFGEEEEEAEE